MLVTITQAARNSLAEWLTIELAPTGGGDGVVVEPRWFESGVPLPPRSISILDAGPRRVEWTDPEQLIVEAGSPGFVNVTWGLGYISQRLQLDVWAQSDVALDDIMARLDIALNAGQRAYNAANASADPVGVGLLLALGDGWEPGTASFTFDEPNTDQTADAANQQEWHASYRGVVGARLVQVATSPVMARIHLNQRLGTGPVNTAAAATLATTIDASTPSDA